MRTRGRGWHGSLERRQPETDRQRRVRPRCLQTSHRARDDDFGHGCRSMTVGEYVIVYCAENEDALILRVVHGRRDLEVLFGH